MDPIKQKRLSRFRRGCEFAYRHTLRRQMSHGVLSLRYLLPGQSRKIRIHRSLWFHGLPRVPPPEVYAFRLYRVDQGSTEWDYVFTHELPAFHRWRDSQHGKTAESLRLLGDKYLSAEMLRKHGVPVVPDLELIPRGAVFDLSACLKQYSRLFCKPRNGSAGRDCFVIERQETTESALIYKTEAGVVGEVLHRQQDLIRRSR